MKKFDVHYTVIILMIFAILIGLIQEFLLILFGLFLHEIGHIILIKIFTHKINKITLYPFGGVIIYENKNDFIYKSILICLGGIFSNFFFFIVFKLIGFHSLTNVNLLILFINLLPIYPLDGGRVIMLLLALFLPYKLSKSIVHYLSIILSVLLTIYLFLNFNGIYLYFLIVFFLKSNLFALISLKKEYQMFLLMKYLNPNNKLKEKETRFWCNNPIECIFMGRYTIFNFETFKTEEKIILKNHFKNKKRLN